MPRKAKIVAVPVDAATVVEPVEQAAQEDKTDAEEMTNVINELKTDDQPVAQEVAEPVAEPTAEPKPKRAPRGRAPSRKKVTEPEPEVVAVEPTVEETTVEVKVPDEKPAVVKDKVACPDCGKEMSAKTLKFSHAPNCTVKKKQSDEQPAAVSEELIEELVQKRWDNVSNNLRRERLARKQAMVEKLIAGAF